MKYIAIVIALGVLGTGAYLAIQSTADHPAKYYAMEAETQVRPAYFEDMKFRLDEGVELRAPASAHAVPPEE